MKSYLYHDGHSPQKPPYCHTALATTAVSARATIYQQEGEGGKLLLGL
jgi:hypothetical protein